MSDSQANRRNSYARTCTRTRAALVQYSTEYGTGGLVLRHQRTSGDIPTRTVLVRYCSGGMRQQGALS